VNADIRRKLDTGQAVEAFSIRYPDESPAGKALTERLIALNDRGEVLAQQQRAGNLGLKSSVVEKARIRKEVRLDLEAMRQITDAASLAQPEIAVRFTLPRPKVSHKVFLTTARVALTTAQTHKELLQGYGLPEGMLERIAEAVDRYEVAVTGKSNALASRVGATADLDAVVEDIMEVVRHVDALNSLRFRDDPEKLAAWKSARNVPWPGSTTAPEVKPAA
jgi:hypothetical protein